VPTALRSRWLWIGVVLLVVGTGPLLVAVLYAWSQGDPNPNPVGPGICAMFTFWLQLGDDRCRIGFGFSRRASGAASAGFGD